MMKKYLLIFLVFTNINLVYSQQSELPITIESIREIKTFHFASDEVIMKIIKPENISNFRSILYLGIAISVNNIVNQNTTRTLHPYLPYKYQYVYIDDTLEIEILEKELFRYIYDPSHPDALQAGKLQGFVRFPDINILDEFDNITRILNILLALNGLFN